jgi:4-amino-4-deoxy-L-arabinose transferase-like glycosyltransferase
MPNENVNRRALGKSSTASNREEPARRQAFARPSPVAFWLLLVVLFTNYVGFLSKLGTLGLTGPDEPRYAAIARNMEETNDWVTPRLQGKPWLEKPVLYYWTAAACFRLLGENDYAARLPSGLAGLGAALVIAWAGSRFFSAATAILALVLMPTAIGMLGFSHAASPDMLFAATLAAAMVVGAELVLAGGTRPRRWLLYLGFGFFLGLAALAKGPAAIVLAGGSAALWASVARRWRCAMRFAHPVAVAAFLATAVPWYACCAARNPTFLHDFLWLHNVARYATPVFHHVQPWWFFAPVLLAMLLPWTALAMVGLRDARTAWQGHDWQLRPGTYFLSWATFIFLFFSVSQSKLPGYVLPALPALLLLFADSAATMIRNVLPRTGARPRRRMERSTGLLLAACWLAIVLFGVRLLDGLPANSPLSLPNLWRWWILSALLGGVAIAALAWGGRIAGALLLNAVLVAGMLEAANWKLLPEISPFLSARASAEVAIAAGAPIDAWRTSGHTGQPIYCWRLDEAWQFGLEYYLRRQLPEFPHDPAAAAKVMASGPVYVFTNETGCGLTAVQGEICQPLEKTVPQVWLVRLLPSSPH